MNKFLKNTLVIAVMILISEFVINKSKIFSIGTGSDWFSFWGNVFGAGVGVLGAYIILRIQLKNDSKKYEETQIDNTFFNMIDLFQNIQSKLEEQDYTQLLSSIRNEKYNYIEKKRWDEKLDLYNRKTKLIQRATKILLSNKSFEGTLFRQYVENITLLATNQKQKVNLFIGACEGMFEEKYSVKQFTKLEEKCLKVFNNLYESFLSIDERYNSYILTEEEIFRIVNIELSLKHSEFGTFLRMFHRLVKYILDSNLSAKKKKEYLGMLRALLSSDEILVIFYNTFYSNRGKGLKKQLERRIKGEKKPELTEFFADKSEIKEHLESEGKIDLPFFKYRELIFPESDLVKIKSLTNYK